jgi:predicted alpha/beta-fold hydrolase
MSSLRHRYRPTPWLLFGLPQTIYGMRYRKRSALLGSETRVLLDLFDGGNLALDLFIPVDSERAKAPFVVILPTLGGTTWEPCTNNLAESFYNRGWPSAVMNGRGFAGVPFKTPRFGVAIDTEDIQDAVRYIRDRFHPPFLFVVGFSMGSIQAVTYVAGNDPLVDGAAIVSHLYDALASSKRIERGIRRRVLMPAIMKALSRTLAKSPFATEEDRAKCTKCRVLSQFDNEFTAPSRGFRCYQEYYAEMALDEKLPLVKVPTLVLGADNDPFIDVAHLPERAARESQNTVLVHVEEGGHVALLTGWSGKKSLIDVIVPDWFAAIVHHKNEQRENMSGRL